MLKKPARKTQIDKNKEFNSNMLNSWPTLKKMLKLRPKRIYQRLSAIFKLRIRDLRMRLSFKKKKLNIQKLRIFKSNKKMKFIAQNLQIKELQHKSIPSVNLKSKRKLKCLKQRLIYLKNHLVKLFQISKRKESCLNSKMNRLSKNKQKN